MEALDALRGSFTRIYAGHHQFPIGPEYVQKYLSCVRGILDGTLQPRLIKANGSPAREAVYEDIRIMLPPEEASTTASPAANKIDR
jgi:hypothetical protein